jgi:F-type H+-transporting ATPase subunit delta
MAGGAAARRYAKALFQLAAEAGQVPAVRAELDALAALLAERPDLGDVLLQPLHPAAQRRAVLRAVAERLQAGALLQSFYQVLIDHRRLVDFDAIRAEFARLADEQAGRRRARVRAAGPLSEAQRDRLRRALAARLGHEVELEVEVQPELLGGLVAQVGDLVFDGSLRTQLRQLRESLASGH